MAWNRSDIPSQTGRRILLTGGNSGIGFHTALELARAGAEIILPARSEAKAARAVDQITAQVTNAKLVPALLDLASLDSIHAFAKFYGGEFPGQSLDVHINNAGIMNLERREMTVDGFERQFATNFLGPFALTALIFPHLKRKLGTRIVSTSSIVARGGKIDFDNLQSERRYQPVYGTYAQTKLADLIFALDLQRRLSAAGSPIISVAAHPGIANTNLPSNMTGIVKFLAPIMTPLIGQSAAQGALPTLFAACSPDIVPGGYYGPDGWLEHRGDPAPAKIPPTAIDARSAERLWAEAERLTSTPWPQLD